MPIKFNVEFHFSFYFYADHTDGATENNSVLPEEGSTARRTTRTSSNSNSSLKSSQCEQLTGELSKRSSRFPTVDSLRNNGITHNDQAVVPNEVNQRIVSKQTLSNTKLPIDQFVAAALANGSVTDESTIKDFSMLQSTLFTLQNQQIFQLKLIERLKSQLMTSSSKNNTTIEDELKKGGDDLKLAAHENENPKSKSNNRGVKERKLR